MSLRLNLLSRPALLALLHRALASGHSGEEALTGLRRIELCQDEQTESLKLVSEYNSTAEILRGKAREARLRAQQTAVDLKLHAEGQPPVGKRSFLGPRLTAAQRLFQQEHRQLGLLADDLAAEAASAERALTDAEARLADARDRLAAAMEKHAALLSALHPELAASVLQGLMAGPAETAAALELLGRARQVARGDLMVGSLFVLSALLDTKDPAEGVRSGRELLRDLHLLFSQHGDPAERVLNSLIQLVEASLQDAAAPRLAELGLLSAGNFAVPWHYRLYLLLLVLSRQDSGSAAAESDPGFAALLGLLGEVLRGTGSAGIAAPPGKDALLLERVLACSLLRSSDAQHLIPQAAGLALDALVLPKGRNPRWPALWELAAAVPADPWPPAALDVWRGALACLLLLGARSSLQPGLYQQWLEESYGWPKNDLYWWTLSTLKDDPALLHNLTGTADQLFCQ